MEAVLGSIRGAAPVTSTVLGDGADFHLEIEPRRLVDFEGDSRALFGIEAGGLDADGVRAAGRQRGKRVAPVGGVTVRASRLVDVLTARTLAFGTDAPAGSTTMPSTDAG